MQRGGTAWNCSAARRAGSGGDGRQRVVRLQRGGDLHPAGDPSGAEDQRVGPKFGPHLRHRRGHRRRAEQLQPHGACRPRPSQQPLPRGRGRGRGAQRRGEGDRIGTQPAMQRADRSPSPSPLRVSTSPAVAGEVSFRVISSPPCGSAPAGRSPPAPAPGCSGGCVRRSRAHAARMPPLVSSTGVSPVAAAVSNAARKRLHECLQLRSAPWRAGDPPAGRSAPRRTRSPSPATG